MITISSCLIVKDEINNLPLLVDDLLKFSDEIILVDTGSTDGTKEWIIAQAKSSDKVFFREFEWINDFAAARNYSFHWASKDWIFWCDADDRISDELVETILTLKTDLQHSNYNSIIMDYQFDANFNVPRRRLVRSSCHPVWSGKCHECLDLDNITDLNISGRGSIIHKRVHPHSGRNLMIFIESILAGDKLTLRDLTYYSNELRDNGFLEKSCEIALQILDQIWEVDAWNCIVAQISHYYMELGKWSKLCGVIQKFLESKPGRGDVFYMLGACYHNLHKYDKALEYYEKALNTRTSGLESYGENPVLSKWYPAYYSYFIYEALNNKDGMSRMKSLLEKLRNSPELCNYQLETIDYVC